MGGNKKERERQYLVHNSELKSKDYDIAKAKQQIENYCDAASAANANVRELALKNRVEVDEL